MNLVADRWLYDFFEFKKLWLLFLAVAGSIESIFNWNLLILFASTKIDICEEWRIKSIVKSEIITIVIIILTLIAFDILGIHIMLKLSISGLTHIELIIIWAFDSSKYHKSVPKIRKKKKSKKTFLAMGQ